MARSKRAAEIIRARKLAKVAAQWSGDMPDKSWMKYARCVLCDNRFCVNNYENHKVRDTRIFGKWVCAWCGGHGGVDNIRRLVLVERLMKLDCLAGAGEEKCKCLSCLARRLFGE